MTRSAKIMLLGDIGVGKSSLAKRLVFDRFDSEYKTTIGVDVLTYDIHLPELADREPLRLVIWDTDGDFGQAIFSTMYVTGAAGALVVSDVTRTHTVEKMGGLITAFEDHLPGRPVMGVLNKIDLLSPEQTRPKLPGHDGSHIISASAANGEGVMAAFKSIAEAVVRRGL